MATQILDGKCRPFPVTKLSPLLYAFLLHVEEDAQNDMTSLSTPHITSVQKTKHKRLIFTATVAMETRNPDLIIVCWWYPHIRRLWKCDKTKFVARTFVAIELYMAGSEVVSYPNI